MQSVNVAGKAIYPSKIICVGRNYVEHIKELQNEVPDSMVVFNKPNSAISKILYSQLDNQTLHYEGELAFMVDGNKLAAVAFGLDLTKRALQTALKQKGLPWERAKAFDGAALFSAFVPVDGNIEQLSLRLEIDGQLRQTGGVPMMIHKPDAVLEELQQFISLEDGDIIMTGTPAGVGQIRSRTLFNGTVLLKNEPLVAAAWTAQ